jgi:hypothetical protein
MRHDDLACANCSGPVSEGRCPVCRASRDQYRRGPVSLYGALWMLLAVVATLVCALALEARFA